MEVWRVPGADNFSVMLETHSLMFIDLSVLIFSVFANPPQTVRPP